MNAMPTRHGRSPSLDALRAGAAGLVLLSHARSLVFRDAGPGLSWPAALFYGVSGLGHQAVIVFFALSGLVVTTSMLRLAASGRWSLPGFAATRLVRLWIVLVPCLLGGALVDRIGLALGTQPYGIPAVGHPAPPVDLGIGTVLGNLAFLQTITVPVLGSNGPLWSLANEGWYYVLAGLAFAAWQARRRPGVALGLAAAALATGALLPPAIVALAPVWGFGAGVALLRHCFQELPTALRRAASWLGSCGVAALLPASRLHWGLEPLAADLALGAAVAALLLALPKPKPGPPDRGADILRRLADGTYSLYLSHVPVLAFAAAVTIGSQRLPVGVEAFGWLASGLGLAVGTGWAVWWSCERHTDRLRAWLARPLLRVPSPTPLAREAMP